MHDKTRQLMDGRQFAVQETKAVVARVRTSRCGPVLECPSGWCMALWRCLCAMSVKLDSMDPTPGISGSNRHHPSQSKLIHPTATARRAGGTYLDDI